MESKQKAVSLIRMMLINGQEQPKVGLDMPEESCQRAKKCAIKLVDEILDLLNHKSTWDNWFYEERDYWNEVKLHMQKL